MTVRAIDFSLDPKEVRYSIGCPGCRFLGRMGGGSSADLFWCEDFQDVGFRSGTNASGMSLAIKVVNESSMAEYVEAKRRVEALGWCGRSGGRQS